MTPSQDALEVAQVLGNKLRPVYTFAAVIVALGGAGVSYVWTLSDFIHRDAVHETQQDDNQFTMKTRLDGHDEAIAEARERNLKIIKVLIEDLALLREIQLETLPRKKREYVKRQFEAQRVKGINLLVETQK